MHTESISTRIPNARVKTIADPFMNEQTEKWAQAHGVENVTTDYHDILNDPEIQAVLICSSTDTHSPISIEAINAGKHVFCEKPIDHDIEKIKRVIHALMEHPVKYQVGFNRRFDHNFHAIRKAIDAGSVGDVQIIKITSRDPEPPSQAYIKVSGGMFMDMTIHDFDMVRFLAGCDADEIYVNAAVLVDPAIGAEGDVDTAIITLKMKNGAVAVIDNSRKSVYGYDQRAEVFGSRGMAMTGNDTPTQVTISNADGVRAEKPLYFFLERYMNAYAEEIKSFINAIENGTETALTVYDGLEAVRMALAANKSFAEHRPVRMDEIRISL